MSLPTPLFINPFSTLKASPLLSRLSWPISAQRVQSACASSVVSEDGATSTTPPRRDPFLSSFEGK